MSEPADPVRARRARVAQWSRRANRVGYLLFGLACVLFVIALVTGFSGPLAVGVIVCLIVGSLLLAPTIVIDYAVKAAEKEDRSRGL